MTTVHVTSPTQARIDEGTLIENELRAAIKKIVARAEDTSEAASWIAHVARDEGISFAVMAQTTYDLQIDEPHA